MSAAEMVAASMDALNAGVLTAAFVGLSGGVCGVFLLCVFR